MSDPTLTLGYAFDEPATVLVTVDDQHPVENTLTLVVTNRSGAAVEFQNPQALSPGSTLPAWNDQQSPLGRISLWFPWGDASGDLASVGDAQRIVASSLNDVWAASPRMSDPDLGVYWTLFPLSKSAFLGQDVSISFQFSGIVSHVGTDGTLPEQSWMTAAPRVPGYTASQDQVAVWKSELSATLTAPAAAAPGDDFALVWKTAGVDSCALDPGDYRGLAPNGSQPVTMPASPSTTWTLTAYPHSGGSPIYSRATVNAQTGWADLGAVPAGLPQDQPVLLWLGERLILANDPEGKTWTSTDGATWSAGGTLPAFTIFNQPNGTATASGGRPWLIGPILFDNAWKLYCSPDGGASWPVVNPSLPFSREGQVVRAAAAFGSVWVFALVTDWHAGVWSSQDGVSWSQHPDPPWSYAEFLPASTAFGGRLWAFGDTLVGPSGDLARYVWSSSDGQTWSQGPMAPWDGEASIVAATATRSHAYVATTPPMGNATLWQMDAQQNWTSVQMPDDLKNAGFDASALALTATDGRLLAYNGVGHMWAYAPPLAEKPVRG
jgi:hypothetical protein